MIYLGPLIALFLSGCDELQEEKREQWEQGVFWGYQAARSGATPSQAIIRAYELREQARRDVQNDKEALSKYRAIP